MTFPLAWVYGTRSPSTDVDPSDIPLAVLARFRGAMWTTRMNLPYGPRPNEDSNIIATDFWADYTPEQQVAATVVIKSRGYTHVVVGPIVDSDGYHGMYPPHDWRQNFDAFLDILQFFWNNGLIPVVFIHPDGWSYEQLLTLTPLFTSARAQRLMRVVVPSGWEPTRYGWSSVTWALILRWGRETFPTALICAHTVADTDAMVGTDARFDDNDPVQNPEGNAGGWKRVALYLHVWLIQNGPYNSTPAANPQLAQNFGDQFRKDVPHSIAWHFAGNAGWPTFSAYGDRPVELVNAECTSYNGVNEDLPESTSQDWGDLAVAAGAKGYLDSGRVAVH